MSEDEVASGEDEAAAEMSGDKAEAVPEVSKFADLGLSQPLLEALTHLGYDRPTPIQEQAIPQLLQGRDMIGQAQTGTGKTAAFGLPMLEQVDPASPEVQALVLTPTRELCIQVTQALRAYGAHRAIQVVAIFGGAPIRSQVAWLKQGAPIVVGTVGRVMDLISRHELVLSEARYVVLDEADEMLDLGFLEDVEKILGRCPQGRQTALFSATMPTEIKHLAESRMMDPVTIKVASATLTIDTVEHFYLEVADQRTKAEALGRVIEAERPDQAIVFVRTKIGTDKLARALGDRGVRVKALHGDMSQGARDGVMIAFKDGRERLLVATDVAARGLDISGVTHVVNFDIPNSPEIYVHRIGRTGRVGRSGRAITLITPRDRPALEAIERHSSIELGEWSANGGAPRKGGGRSEKAESTAAEKAKPAAEATTPAVEKAKSASETAEPAAETTKAVAESAEPASGAATPAGTTPPLTRDEQPAEAEPTVRETRRPRHTKPNPARDGARARLLVGAGRVHGIEPADIIGALVDRSHLEGEEVTGVRVLERFSGVEVPAARASEVVDQVGGHEVRGVELRLELARR